MWKEFKTFAMRGNVVDMAVGIVIGASFGAIVKALVDNVIMPPIGLLLGRVDFSELMLVLKQGDPAGPYLTTADAQAAGAVTMNYGLFINSVISFIIVAFAVFLLVKAVNRMKAKEEAAPPPAPTTRDCPQCKMAVPLAATRCGHCTSAIQPA